MENESTGFKTKQKYVYQTLRDEIMRCELVPSERLVIKDIAERLEVSPIPVREALQLLQSDKLVVHVPHVGTIVSPISKNDIVETFTIKEGLEGVSARSVAQVANSAQIVELQTHLAIMDEVVKTNQLERWGSLNRQFHLMLTGIANMPMLREMHVHVLDKWDRIQRYYFQEVVMYRHCQSQKEHYEILNAIVQGDAYDVERIIRLHNVNALKDYMSLTDATSE